VTAAVTTTSLAAPMDPSSQTDTGALLDRLHALEGVPSALAAARDGIDAVLRDRGLRRTAPDVTAESLLRGAQASAVLEGSRSTLDEVRSGAGDEMARASVRLSTELLALAPVLRRSPLQALARLHTVAAAGALPEDQLGRPRDAAATQLVRTVSQVLAHDAPALLVAAVVHGELLSGSTRRRWSSPRPDTSRCARRTRGTPARSGTAGSRPCTAGCCMRPRPTPRQPRRARCATPDVRAAPDSRRLGCRR
jgi:hypothetical protein